MIRVLIEVEENGQVITVERTFTVSGANVPVILMDTTDAAVSKVIAAWNARV